MILDQKVKVKAAWIESACLLCKFTAGVRFYPGSTKCKVSVRLEFGSIRISVLQALIILIDILKSDRCIWLIWLSWISSQKFQFTFLQSILMSVYLVVFIWFVLFDSNDTCHWSSDPACPENVLFSFIKLLIHSVSQSASQSEVQFIELTTSKRRHYRQTDSQTDVISFRSLTFADMSKSRTSLGH